MSGTMESKKKRVLVISNMYPGKLSKTYGIFVKNQVEALRNCDFHVDVAAVNDPRVGKYFVIKKYLIWMIKILFAIITRGKHYDVVHAHYVFPSGLFGMVFKKLFGSRLIITSHGGDIDKMSKKGPFFYNQTKKILNASDHVIAVGEVLKKEIEEVFGIDNNKISILNMGVNRDVFVPLDKEQTKSQLSLSLNKFHILYVGNYIEAKGLLELLDAYKKIKKTHASIELHLIGSTKQESFTKQLHRKVEIEKLKDVYIHPAMNQEEVAQWMAAADVFVLPSHIEGFGLVALEAMSCHTPVVGSMVGGLTTLLNDGAGVLVEPKNIDSIADGLTSVIESESLRNRLVGSGEIKAESNDQKILLKKLINIYQGNYKLELKN